MKRVDHPPLPFILKLRRRRRAGRRSPFIQKELISELALSHSKS
jgi:hypothetical protein